jgi:hypothetical protein
MKVVKRAEWGAKPPKSRAALQPARVTTFFLHHAAGTYPSGVEAMRRIQRQHQDTNGWADYAYNFGVWDDGQIFEGRGWGAQGGHTRGHNSTGVAVCYMGDGRKPVPKAALDAILACADDADRHFGKRLDRRAHRDVGATQCPGDWLYEWWESSKTRSDALRAPDPRSDTSTPENPQNAAGATTGTSGTEQAFDSEGWANRPKWVTKVEWQNLIDWTRRNR